MFRAFSFCKPSYISQVIQFAYLKRRVRGAGWYKVDWHPYSSKEYPEIFLVEVMTLCNRIVAVFLKTYITDYKNAHYKFYISNHFILQFYDQIIIRKRKSCVMAPKLTLMNITYEYYEYDSEYLNFYYELRILI